MTFMTSGLAVSVAWDAARLHEVARIMGRRSQLLKLVGWVLTPCWVWILVAFLLLWGYQIMAMEAYSAAGKIHLRQQAENQKEHAI
ncbi:hypothetical protein [uncultured Corynebacterium sp.]|uniref:hypothetical protein n=1 Tax=uncultured Corynebacterium sp. TaxID=159447 RepID=UPI0028E6A456|nr:hypothetical protein [uncultured Corynebacterium sp.]